MSASRRGRRAPTLLTLAHRLVRDERLFERGDLVVCACSGGPDSNALLHALALLRRRIGHQLLAVGVDHGLRSAAPQELALAQAVAEQQQVPFEGHRVDVEPGGNLQARARSARLGALQRVAAREGARAIATGHTADDRAETVLLRLLRGAGPRGLAVLPPQAASPVSTPAGGAVDLVRPLLRCRRADVMAHLERHELCHAEDPSNRDKRFMRVRVRHELLPLLEQLSPKVVEHLCALADMLAQADQPDGAVAELSRAQRQALARAIQLRNSGATVRVRGGRDLEVRFFAGTPVVFAHK